MERIHSPQEHDEEKFHPHNECFNYLTIIEPLNSILLKPSLGYIYKLILSLNQYLLLLNPMKCNMIK
jgi:hypothetical protein